MPYVDLDTVHNPSTGGIAPAAWGDQVRENFEFLIDPPAVSVFASSNQTLTTATPTAITADSENYDTDGMHDSVSNTTRITVNTPGRYLFSTCVRFGSGSTGFRQVQFRVNGSTFHNVGLIPAPTGPSGGVISGSRTLVLTQGDYVEVVAQHSQGSDLPVALEELAAFYFTR